ncbi:MAG: hypothetical protein J5565_03490 [Muribaculaceae bacterium]|nr:hypothetical protein [Muribaculaceae bacterium]
MIEVVALAILAMVTVHLFDLSDAISLTLALTIAYAVPRMLYTSRKWCTPLGRAFLCAVSFLMVSLAVLTVWERTAAMGLPFSTPHLISDDGNYFRWALSHYNGLTPQSKVAFPGFPLVMLALFKLFGPSIVWPLAMNVLFTLTTIVITGAMAIRLLHGRIECSDRWTATLAIGLTATLMFFLSQGLRIQKEAMLYLGITMCGYVLAGMNRSDASNKTVGWREVALWTTACTLMALARTTYLYFAFIGLGIFLLSNWRKNWRKIALFTVISGLLFTAGNLVARYSIEGHISIVGGGYYMQKDFLRHGSAAQPYLDIVGKYFYYSIWHRLALLPLSSSVQFIIPFPWVYSNATVLNVFPRIAWGWYIVGGITLYYFFCVSWRKKLSLGAWPWWPAAIFVTIAYVFAGVVSRYILPIQPLAVPLAVYVVALLRAGKLRKLFFVWSVTYIVVLAATLIICHQIQVDYLHNMEEYYRSLMLK